jgi:hypothetical protein
MTPNIPHSSILVTTGPCLWDGPPPNSSSVIVLQPRCSAPPTPHPSLPLSLWQHILFMLHSLGCSLVLKHGPTLRNPPLPGPLGKQRETLWPQGQVEAGFLCFVLHWSLFSQWPPSLLSSTNPFPLHPSLSHSSIHRRPHLLHCLAPIPSLFVN